jgi:superfamily II DNA or RNA helicase
MKLAKIDVGLVQGNHVNENHQVVACTVQSAHKLNRIDYEAVIVDEAHNANQERYQTFLKRWGFLNTVLVFPPRRLIPKTN